MPRLRPPILTDGVVTLDVHTLADVAAHLAGEDEEQARRFGWYPAHSTHVTVAAAIRGWRQEWRVDGPRRTLALRDAQNGQLAGGCELRMLGAGAAELSYWVFPVFRGRGLAARALSLFMEWAAPALAITRFELAIEPDNLASIGVARRAGFSPTGTRHEEGVRQMLRFVRLVSSTP